MKRMNVSTKRQCGRALSDPVASAHAPEKHDVAGAGVRMHGALWQIISAIEGGDGQRGRQLIIRFVCNRHAQSAPECSLRVCNESALALTRARNDMQSAAERAVVGELPADIEGRAVAPAIDNFDVVVVAVAVHQAGMDPLPAPTLIRQAHTGRAVVHVAGAKYPLQPL